MKGEDLPFRVKRPSYSCPATCSDISWLHSSALPVYLLEMTSSSNTTTPYELMTFLPGSGLGLNFPAAVWSLPGEDCKNDLTPFDLTGL